ncbi:MAG: DUF2849 domain-containing protein [Alphaproteobacteria bacterium]|nr:DUF2849 domain-containing protein [Alphaproteobacteria bacterium]
MPNVFTANRLSDGLVVYLGRDGNWLRDLASAGVAEDKDGIAVLEAMAAQSAKDQIIVGAYPMDVEIDAGKPRAKSVRERIRAAHRPTIKPVSEAN